MIIKVTREHIEEGTPEDGDSCMVALAIKEQVPGVDEYSVHVDGDNAKFTVGERDYHFSLPEDVRDHIYTFDNGCEILIDDEDGELIGEYERDTSIIPEFEFELPLEAHL